MAYLKQIRKRAPEHVTWHPPDNSQHYLDNFKRSETTSRIPYFNFGFFKHTHRHYSLWSKHYHIDAAQNPTTSRISGNSLSIEEVPPPSQLDPLSTMSNVLRHQADGAVDMTQNAMEEEYPENKTQLGGEEVEQGCVDSGEENQKDDALLNFFHASFCWFFRYSLGSVFGGRFRLWLSSLSCLSLRDNVWYFTIATLSLLHFLSPTGQSRYLFYSWDLTNDVFAHLLITSGCSQGYAVISQCSMVPK